MQNYTWYQSLKKPSWAPPASIFGPVWTVLYILIAISFGKVFWLAWQGTISFYVALPFILNLIFNILYTPLMFRLKNIPLATIDILLVLFTLRWAMGAISHFVPWITLIQFPYFLWVGFATILQVSIYFLNKK